MFLQRPSQVNSKGLDGECVCGEFVAHREHETDEVMVGLNEVSFTHFSIFFF